jgi:HEAT repeat protein
MTPVALSKFRISRLVARLNSQVEAEAKQAASELDGLFYPNYGPGPREVAAAEAQQITDNHFRAIRGSKAIEPLFKAMVEGAEFARAYAATVLGAIGDIRALPLVVDALADSSPKVRLAATQGLRFFREPSTVPGLIRALQDPALEVRCSAACSLGLIRSAEAVPPLMEFYERGNRESKVAALHALGYICDPRSLPLARAALLDKVRKVRDAAKSALAQYDFKRRQGT